MDCSIKTATKGLVYVAFGEEYDKLTAHTVAYSRKFTDLPVCVITNLEKRHPKWDEVNGIEFKRIAMRQDENRQVKTSLIQYSPFERSVFIDSDAVIQKRGIERVFEWLDDHDVMLRFRSVMTKEEPGFWEVYTKMMRLVGEQFPLQVYSSAFFGFRKNEAARKFFEMWNSYWRLSGQGRDMPALACTAKRTGAKIRVVTNSDKVINEEINVINFENIIHHRWLDRPGVKSFFEVFNIPQYNQHKPFDKKPQQADSSGQALQDKDKLIDDILEKKQWLSTAEIEQYQWQDLKDLLEHSYRNVPFYRRKFDSIGLTVHDVRSMDDFRKIPILRKADIQQNLEAMRATNCPSDQIIRYATVDSTGWPLVLYKDLNAKLWMDAAALRFRRWIGYRLEDKLALICNAAGDVRSATPSRRWLNPFDCSEDDIERFVAELVQWKPDAIRGCASSVYVVASCIKKKGLKAPRPKAVEISAEKLQDRQRKVVEEVFGCKVFEVYGAREVPAIACECECHNGMHISSDLCLVEVIKDGKCVKPGEEGSLVVTDLVNYGMPLIRYEIGDVGVISRDSCPCGRGFPLLKAVEEHIAGTIQTPDGKQIDDKNFSRLSCNVESVADTGQNPVTAITASHNSLLKSILFIVDRPGWAHDFKTDNLIRRLGDRFSITKRYEDNVTASDIAGADLVVLYYWRQLNHSNMPGLLDEFIQNRHKLLIGICSHQEMAHDRDDIIRVIRYFASGVFVNSMLLYREFSQFFEVPVFYTPNGVDTEFFTPAFGRPSNRKLRVGWAGSIKNHGGTRGYHDLILPAISSAEGVELAVAAREDKWRNKDEMLEFYRSIDVYICASAAEGTPNPCLEAAACGVPLLTTRVGNMPELIENGKNGLFIERDVNDIKNKVIQLRDNPALRLKMSSEILKSIRAWDWRVQARNYEKMFESMLGVVGDTNMCRRLSVAQTTCNRPDLSKNSQAGFIHHDNTSSIAKTDRQERYESNFEDLELKDDANIPALGQEVKREKTPTKCPKEHIVSAISPKSLSALDMRVIGSEYGGWAVDLDLIPNGSTIISAGVGEDITFDEGLITLKNCRVIGIDPTEKARKHVEKKGSSKIIFLQKVLSARDGQTIKIYKSANPDWVSESINPNHQGVSRLDCYEAPTISLRSLLETYDNVSILKMDIEGAEYEVLNSICELNIPQVCIEFHHFCTDVSDEDTNRCIKHLEQMGYVVAYRSPLKGTIKEATFVHKDYISTAEPHVSVQFQGKKHEDDVPVALITYNRPKHTYEVLRALREHNIRNLYIFSDGPKKEEDVEKIALIRKLARTINWTRPKIIEQKENVGLARNIVGAADHILAEHDRVIVLEDDCIPQKYFFHFMDFCLNRYKDNDKIFGISGYTVQIPEHILKRWPYDLYFYPRIGSWGWATWKSAWQYREKDLKAACQKAQQMKIDISQGGNDVPIMIEQFLAGKLKEVWTLNWVLSVYLHRGCYVYPTKSHVKNIGFDGSGVHVGTSTRNKFASRIADSKPQRFPEDVVFNEAIYNNFRTFYDITNRPRASISVAAKTSNLPVVSEAPSKSMNQNPLKIVHVCTQDHGGAGRAAYRLHKALQMTEHDSSMLVISKRSNDPSVHIARSSVSYEEIYKRNRMMLARFPDRPVGLEMYSDNFGAVDLAEEPLIQQADVVNLHWVAGMLDYNSIHSVLKNKIIVWTLHDMNPFTGGCHYSGTCRKYTQGCGACSQLGSAEVEDLSSQVWRQKRKAYEKTKINIVTPSSWLAGCAKESTLFSDFDVKVIPNSVPADIYQPYPNREVRRALSINEDAKVILFGADSIVNERKGFRFLLEAVKTLELGDKSPIYIATFGGMPKNVRIEAKYPVYNFGHLTDEIDLAVIYSMADVFVLPSLEDNLPNIVLEAMACGTPVVGFDVGGIPDMVEHQKTGYLAKLRDVKSLNEGIKWVLSASSEGIDISQACRKKVEELYTPNAQAKAYENLYRRLTRKTTPLIAAKPITAKPFVHEKDYLVSAIVSTYNSERFIRGCLEDLENQTIADRLEIIVVNSGSQQNEEVVVKEFQQRYDNIKYIKTLQRETIYHAWNRAIETASGKYITVANTDDRRRKDAIEVMADVLESNRNIALVYADQYETSNENETFGNVTVSRKNVYPDFERDVFLTLGWCNMGSQPMWRAKIHQEIGYFDENFEIAGDYDFLLRVCEKYECFHIPQVLGTFYRSAGKTISCSNVFRLGKVENPLAKARSLVRKGTRSIEEGDYSNGVEYLQKSLQCWPSREAVEHIQMVAEKTGQSRGAGRNVRFEFLASVWDWPKEMTTTRKPLNIDREFNDADSSKYLLSVVIASCKTVEEIKSCLEQLAEQNIADAIEVQLVGETKLQCSKVLEEYNYRFSNLACIEVNEGENIWGGVNRALKSSAGRYVTILKPDYGYGCDGLGRMTKILEENMNKAGAYSFSQKNWYDFGLMMWRRCLHEQFGWFDESFYAAADLEFRYRIEQDYDFIEISDIAQKKLKSSAEEHDFDNFFESGLIENAYKYAKLCSIHIDEGGISGHKTFSRWFEVNILKKRTWERLHGKRYNPIIDVSNNRRGAISPLLSVVIVTCGAGDPLKENLDTLALQTEKNFEIIIVFNGKSNTGDDISNDLSICRVYLDNNYGPSLARNTGAAHSRAQYVAFLDDDAVADEDFVKNIISHFKQDNIISLRGRVLSPCGGYVPDNYDLGDEAIPYAADTEENCAFKKDAFIQAGGFGEWLFHGEGMDLSHRIFKSTGEDIDRMFYFPDVIVYHQPYGNQLYRLERVVRADLMEKLIRERNPDIDKYQDYMFNFYPNNRKGIENKLGRLFNNASFLLDKKPKEALEWASIARKNFPNALGPRFVLGSAYFKLGMLQKAQDELSVLFLTIEEIFAQKAQESKDLLAEKREAITDMYLQTVLQLSQCCSRLGDYNMVKSVYERALRNTQAEIPSKQRNSMENLLQKLNSMPLSQIATALPEESGSTSPSVPQKEYLVSAIVSTYNAEGFVRGCLEDLEGQTIADKIEIIVVNSGSQQNEESIVRELQKKYDNIVYIKTEQKEGVYSAWNRAIKIARGKFLTNANTDDRHRRDALEILSNELINNPGVALVYADQICTDTPNATFEKHNAVEMHPQPDYSRERLLLGCCVGSQPMWRSSLHEEFGYFDETLDCAADWDFWLRVSGKYAFKRVPEFLGLYYFNREGIEHGNMFHSYYERYAVGKRYGTEYISTLNTYQTKRDWLVSAILPAYNAEKYINQAIESVLIQNYRHFELVIINDGSTDRTEQIINSYKDEHIRYFKQANRGLAATHNEGIRQSRGEFLIKIDADDFIAVDFIGRHLNEFYNHRDADMVYCDDYLVEEDGKPIRIIKRPEYSDRRILIRDLFRAGFPVVPFRTCINRRVFEKIGLFDESLRIGEDYDMMKRFVKAGLKAQHLKAALYYRRMTSESLSRKYSINKARAHFGIVKSYAETFSHDELFPGVKWELIPSGMRQLHFKCLVAMNFISLGRTYIETNLPSYARVALESAGEQLRSCLEIDPGNDNVQKLIDRCRQLEENLPQDVLMNV
jgi:FkbM family methyltransferase